MPTCKTCLLLSFLITCLAITSCVATTTNTKTKTCSSLSGIEKNQLRKHRELSRGYITDGDYSAAINSALDAEILCHSSVHDNLIAEASHKMEIIADQKGKERKAKRNKAKRIAIKARREAKENRRIWEEAQHIEATNKAADARKAEQDRQAADTSQLAEIHRQRVERAGRVEQTKSLAESFAQKITVRLVNHDRDNMVCINVVDAVVPCSSSGAIKRTHHLRVKYEFHVQNRNNIPIQCGFRFDWHGTGYSNTQLSGQSSGISVNARSRETRRGSDSDFSFGSLYYDGASAICIFHLPTNEQIKIQFSNNSTAHKSIEINERTAQLEIHCIPFNTLVDGEKVNFNRTKRSFIANVTPSLHIVECTRVIKEGHYRKIVDGVVRNFWRKAGRQTRRTRVGAVGDAKIQVYFNF